MADVNVQLKKPKNFDAKAIANKKVLGVNVLDSSQQKQVYKGADGIKNAQNQIDKTQDQVDDAAYECDEAEDTKDDAESDEDAAPTEGDMTDLSAQMSASSSVAQGHIEMLEEAQGEMDEYYESAIEDTEAQYEIIDSANGELETISAEMDSLMAELDSMGDDGGQGSDMTPKMCSAPANNSDGMGGTVDANFDGTGSGLKSAYSLSTGNEADEANQGAPGAGSYTPKSAQASTGSTGSTGSTAPATTPSTPSAGGSSGSSSSSGSNYENIINQVNSYAAMAGDYQAAITAAQENAAASGDAATEYMNGITDSANDVTAEGEEASERNATAREFAQGTQEAGNVMKYAGMATQAVGVGLQAAGAATTTSGAFIDGIGTALCSLGAPLCSLFGAGTPIVAGGTVTMVEGTATLGAGTALGDAGIVTSNVGRGIKYAGDGLQAVASATLTYVALDEGDWRGAVTNAIGTVANAASCVGGVADSFAAIGEHAGNAMETASRIADVAGTVGEYADMANSANNIAWGCVDMKTAIDNGDVSGVISNGFGIASNAVSLAGGINKQIGKHSNGEKSIFGKNVNQESSDKVFDKIGKRLSTAQGAVSTVSYIKNGEVENAITSGLGTVATGLSISDKTANAGNILSGVTGMYTNGKAAYNSYKEGDTLAGIDSTINFMGSAGQAAGGVKGVANKVQDKKDTKQANANLQKAKDDINNNKDLTDEQKAEKLKELSLETEKDKIKDARKSEKQKEKEAAKAKKKEAKERANEAKIGYMQKEVDAKKNEIKNDALEKYDAAERRAIENTLDAKKALDKCKYDKNSNEYKELEKNYKNAVSSLDKKQQRTLAYIEKVDAKYDKGIEAARNMYNEDFMKKAERYTKGALSALNNVNTAVNDVKTMSLFHKKDDDSSNNTNGTSSTQQSGKSRAEIEAILNRYSNSMFH